MFSTIAGRRTSPGFLLKVTVCLAGLLVGAGGLDGAWAQDQAQPAQSQPAQPAQPQPAQPQPAPAAPAAPTPGTATPDTAAPAAKPFTQEQLRKLLAPIALYSDSLLAQVLPASAYPIDIVEAARWLQSNQAAAAKSDFSGADAQNWDPSVKALLRFPTVLDRMNTDIDWTKDLGDAFVAQPDDVAATIQALRREAQAAGCLKSNKQQTIVTERQGGADVVVIRDAEPGVVYVPTYDPVAVYEPGNGAVAAGLIGFGLGVATAAIINNNYWNWRAGWVYPGRWAGYPGYRPINGANVRINNINVNNYWRPNPNRFHPTPRVQRAMANRPGAFAHPGGVINNATRAGMAGPRTGTRPGVKGGARTRTRVTASHVRHGGRAVHRAAPRRYAGPRMHAGPRMGPRPRMGGMGGMRRFGGGGGRRPVRRYRR